jgi:hypothetical protein
MSGVTVENTNAKQIHYEIQIIILYTVENTKAKQCHYEIQIIILYRVIASNGCCILYDFCRLCIAE